MNYSIIMTKNVEFILTDNPSHNMLEFNNFCRLRSVNYIIRISKDKYNIDNNIIVKDLFFNDGDYPPDSVINEFNNFIEECKNKFVRPVIVIHCTAGLGRAPCLIALEMINDKVY